MTRKDYEKIAKVFRDTVAYIYEDVNPYHRREEIWGLEHLQDRMVEMLGADNPNFKPDTFRKACGL
jgi:hypothetical protein